MQAGKHLGPYEIVELLGAGGMGEVWLALDPRLGRKVAIKVLPAEFAADPERLARFEQEARAAAALNHPNIAVVHDIGADGSTHFMVQEHLEGSTLRDRIAAGPLPLQESLTLAAEIAEALVAAHAIGIVHRDLKPDNVFITRAGHAKVLDFGLAKLLDPGGLAGGDATMSPTMVGTMAGAVMGTAGYMAPEQIQGQEVDGRSDLFAFGCVLYEMLSGTRAFAGRTLHQTLDLVLSDTPGGEAAGDLDVPDRLRWVLDKCLAKEPARRYQGADDLAVDLRWLGEAAAAGNLESAAPVPAAPDPMGRNAWIAWWLPVGVAAVLAIVTWGSLGSAPAPERAVRFAIPVPGSLGSVSQVYGAGLAVAPDGSAVVMRGRDAQGTVQLWRRPIDSVELAPIPGTAGAETVAFSPDSRSLVFYSAGEVFVLDIDAGVATAIGAVGTNVRGLDWGPDGWIVVGHSDDFGDTLGLQRVNVDGSGVELLVEPAAGDSASYRFPVFLPGGREILFTIEDDSVASTSEKKLAIYSLEAGTIDELPVRGTHVRFAASGHLLFGRRGELIAVPFDLAARRVLGSEAVIAERMHVNDDRGDAQLAVSSAGIVAYEPGYEEAWGIARVGRDGQAALLPGEPRQVWQPQLSPDGRRLVVSVYAEGTSDLWIYELAQGTAQRFTSDGSSTMGVWSPDGRSLVYQSYVEGVWSTVRSPLETPATRETIELGEGRISERSLQFHPDGETIVFLRFGDVWVVSPDGARALVETPFLETWATFSPDGNWVAYLSQERGRDRVYVTPYPGPGRQWMVSQRGGNEPVWSPDGSELYFTRGNTLLAAAFDPGREPPVGEAIELFTDPHLIDAQPQEPTYVAAPGGGFITFVRPESEPPSVRVITGLDAVLERLAPARERDD